MFPLVEISETTGLYVLRATHESCVICEALVHVFWVGHHSEPQPFLGFRSEESSQEPFREVLRRFAGRQVELSFTPFEAKGKGGSTREHTQGMKEKHAREPLSDDSRKMGANSAGAVANSSDPPDCIIREYIDFVNQQVGVYIGCSTL